MEAKKLKGVIEPLKANDPTLTSLDLTFNNVDPVPLIEVRRYTINAGEAKLLAEALKQNTILTSLELGCNHVGNAGATTLAEALKHNSTLTYLELSWNDIGDTGAQYLAQTLEKNTTLTSLDLAGNAISDAGAKDLAQALEKNTSLTSLNLYNNKIGDAGATALAEALKQNTALTFLSLVSNKIGDVGANYLAQSLEKNTALTSLNLANNAIGDTGAKYLAQALEKNTALTSLALRLNSIGNADTIDHKRIEEILQCNKLKKNDSTLTYLKFREGDFTADGTKALAAAFEKNTTLTYLELVHDVIDYKNSIALAAALKNNVALTSISLTGKNIDAEGAMALAIALEKNTILASLVVDLSYNTLGDKGAQRITKMLEKTSAITSLYLGSNNIGDAGAMVLATGFKTNLTLTSLNLHDNKIGADGAITLATALEKNNALISLNLSSNNIGDAGTIAFAEVLKHNTALTSLYLNANNIGADGANALATALEKNAALISLYLERNLIRAEGTKVLANALKKNITLAYFDLGWNYICVTGAKELASMLEKNTTLTSLRVKCNNLNDDSAKAFSSALNRNTTLTYLNLVGNNISAEDNELRRSLLQQNTALTSLDLDWHIIYSTIGREGSYRFEKILDRNCQLRDKFLAAAEKGDLAAVQNLHKNGVALNGRKKNDGMTALHLAAENGHLAVLKYLIDCGVSVNLKNKIYKKPFFSSKFSEYCPAKKIANQTALHLAAQKGHLGIVKYLIQQGAQWNVRNMNYQTPLAVAQANGHQAVVGYLKFLASPHESTPDSYSSEANNKNAVHQIDFTDKKIDAASITNVSQSIKAQSDVQEINLGVNQIDDAALKKLSPAIEGKTDLHSLDLSVNNIGDKGIEALGTTLKSLPSLVSLNLSGNIIGDEGLSNLRPLEESRSIATLNVSANKISDNGAKEIASFLEKNSSIVTLNLTANDIGDKGASAILSAMENNYSLVKLDLHFNPISAPIKKSIQNILVRNEEFGNRFLAAAAAGDIHTLQQLLQQGVSIHFHELRGTLMTALHYAAQNGRVEVVNLLINAGAFLFAKDGNDQTALQVAEQSGHYQVMELMQARGTSPVAKITAPVTSSVQPAPFNSANTAVPSSLNSPVNLNPISRLKNAKNPSFDEVKTIPADELHFGKILGDGEFGIVYKGKWNRFDVALKKLKGVDLPESAIREFKKEALIFSQTNDPHVVRFFGVAQKEKIWILVTEFCAQGTLYGYLHSKNGAASSWQERLIWGFEIAKGIEYLHNHKIVHNDLACRNVLLDKKHRAKISDFGLSELENYPSEDVGNQKVPFAWWAPERITGNILPQAFGITDMYSLGILLWEIATNGQTPLSGSDIGHLNPAEKVGKVLHGYRDPIPSETPKEFREAIEKCREGNPKQRLTAEQVVQDFKQQTINFFPFAISTTVEAEKKLPNAPDSTIVSTATTAEKKVVNSIQSLNNSFPQQSFFATPSHEIPPQNVTAARRGGGHISAERPDLLSSDFSRVQRGQLNQPPAQRLRPIPPPQMKVMANASRFAQSNNNQLPVRKQEVTPPLSPHRAAPRRQQTTEQPVANRLVHTPLPQTSVRANASCFEQAANSDAKLPPRFRGRGGNPG